MFKKLIFWLKTVIEKPVLTMKFPKPQGLSSFDVYKQTLHESIYELVI